jgi:hypothetical protein
VGCQLVALNFQTNDAPLILNDGLFRQNLGCGYLTKPTTVMAKPKPPQNATAPAIKRDRDMLDQMMETFEDVVCGEEASAKLLELKEDAKKDKASVEERLEANELGKKEKETPMIVKVRVLSGSCLPKPNGQSTGEHIDPYVVITLHDIARGKDAKASYVSSTHTTATVNDNGFCPVWNEKAPKDFFVYSPQVAMVNFTVGESDVGRDDVIGHAAIPVSCLRKGYRSIQLYDPSNERSGPFGFATLLVEIQLIPAAE